MPENIFGVDEAIGSSQVIEGVENFFDPKELIPDDGVTPIKKDKVKPDAKKPLIKQEDEESEEEKEAKLKEEESKTKAVHSFFDDKKEEEAEDEDDEEKEKSKSKDAPTEEEEKEENQFEYLSKQMYEAGIFQSYGDDQPIATNEGEFAQLFKQQSVEQANEWIEGVLAKFGDDRRELFDAVFINGVDPAKYLPAYNSVQSLENLSMDEEGNQERVVREFYRRNGIAEDRISKKIDKLKEQAYLQEEAEDLYPQLLAKDKEQLEQQETSAKNKLLNEKAQDDLYKNNLIKTIQEQLKTKDLNGIPLTDRQANELYDMTYTKRWKTPDGRRLTDFDVMVSDLNKPENIKAKLTFAHLWKTNFDFSKIKAKAISNESNALFSKFAKKDATQNTKSKQKENSTNKWGVEL